MSDSATPWAAHARPPCFSPTPRVCPSPLSIESVLLSNHLILCCPLFLSPLIFPSVRVFSNELALHIRWPKYWSFSFSISSSSEYSGLISFRLASLISLQSKGLSRIYIYVCVCVCLYTIIHFIYVLQFLFLFVCHFIFLLK